MNTNTTTSSLYNWTQIIYALHAASLLTGILGAATVVGAFLIGWPSIIAVVLNYVKRGEARGTWLESHFRWQIRTFWYGLLWVCLCGAFVVLTFGIGLIVVWIPLIIVSLWFIYRVARGWIALRDGKPMYVRAIHSASRLQTAWLGRLRTEPGSRARRRHGSLVSWEPSRSRGVPSQRRGRG